jgi:hypothetical protein
MPDHAQDYVASLAAELRNRHPALQPTTVEDDLALLRARLAIVARFIHDPLHDRAAREALARDLQLPAPAPEAHQ